jgi:hypothetical protein
VQNGFPAIVDCGVHDADVIRQMILGVVKKVAGFIAAGALTAAATTSLPSAVNAQAITSISPAFPPGFYESAPNGIVMHIASDHLPNTLVSDVQLDGTFYRYFSYGHGRSTWYHIDPRLPRPNWSEVGAPRYFRSDQQRYDPRQHLNYVPSG